MYTPQELNKLSSILLLNYRRFAYDTKTVTEDYSINIDDDVIFVDTTEGDVVITLPASYTARKIFTIRKLVNLNVLTVQIDSETSDKIINGSLKELTEIDINYGETPEIWSDGDGNYYIGGTYGTTEALDNFPGIEFFWSDNVNKIIYHASEGEYALTIRVKVIQEFTGLAALSIVYGNDNTELVPADAIDLTAVGEYEYYPSHEFTAAADVKLNLNIDTSLQGSGIIFITRTTNIL